jgi:hypothetical protein
MDKKQNSKIKMFGSVSGILDSNETIVEKTPGLKAAFDLLVAYLAAADRYIQLQGETGKEVTQEKVKVRKDLETAFINVKGAIRAYAVNATDPAEKLFKAKYKYADSTVEKFVDRILFAQAYLLYSDANPIAAKLVPFATQADVTSLKTLADDFHALLPKKREKVSVSAVSTSNLADTLDKIDELLEDTIDVLVEGLRFVEADFYNTYQNAKVIIDAPTYKKEKPENPETKP